MILLLKTKLLTDNKTNQWKWGKGSNECSAPTCTKRLLDKHEELANTKDLKVNDFTQVRNKNPKYCNTYNAISII